MNTLLCAASQLLTLPHDLILQLEPVGTSHLIDVARDRPISLRGAGTLSTEVVYGGKPVLRCPGGGAGAVVGGDQTDFDFGLADFSIECMVYRTATAPSTTGVLVARATVNDQAGWALVLKNNCPALYLSAIGGNTWSLTLSDPTTLPLNKWTRIRAARENGVTSLYVNDTVVASTTVQVNTHAQRTYPVIVGTNSDGSHSFIGYISGVKVTRSQIL